MKSIKVSDFIAEFLFQNGCEVVFGVSGGASLHLLDSIVRHPGIRLVTAHHEQTVAMATEAFSRINRKLGVGIVTSGPGATNLTTGIAGAFYDSIPCIFITGQVSTFRKSDGLGVRQYGFQETPTADMFKFISKLSIEISDPQEIEEAMWRALQVSMSGRPGPVVIDIPDNIQRQNIEVEKIRVLSDFTDDSGSQINERFNVRETVSKITNLLENCSRPVIVCGWGVVLSGQQENVLSMLDSLNIPTALTWGAKAVVPDSRSYLLGTFGTHGSRKANLSIQNADLLIVLGSRLDTKATGSPPETFAPNAKKVMFDIDPFEYTKFEMKGISIDHFFQVDFRSHVFMETLLQLQANRLDTNKFENWHNKIRSQYSVRENYPDFEVGVDPYAFINHLSEIAPENSRVIIDTGCAIAWTMQTWKTLQGQQFFHDFNNTAMGWSIPASVASSLSLDLRPTICLIGDGSLMMTIGDLSTLANLSRPITIFLLNNSGYAMIRQTQDQWFESRYFASDKGQDLFFPDFEALALSFGFDYRLISDQSEFFDSNELKGVLATKTFVEVRINPGARVVPQNRFGNPIDIMEP